MKITKRQLRRIIKEALSISHDEVVTYLTDRASSYYDDPGLVAAGPSAIRTLLQDDFMDDLGHIADIRDYSDLIEDLSQGDEIINEEEVLREDDLEEYGHGMSGTSSAMGAAAGAREKYGDRSRKPDMGCKDRRTGKPVDPYWQQRMGRWVCP
jgi:hypothetical protein